MRLSRLLAFEDHSYVIGCGGFVVDGSDRHELPTLIAENIEFAFFGRVDAVVFGPNVDDPVLPADRFHHASPLQQWAQTGSGLPVRDATELSQVAGAESVASTFIRDFVTFGAKELCGVGRDQR